MNIADARDTITPAHIRRGAGVLDGGRLALTLALTFGGTCTGALGGAAPARAATAWVQMTTHGAEARLVTSAGECPPLLVDGRSRPTILRAAPTPDFPNRVCTAPLTPRDRQLALGGARLAAPVPRVNRLVILGDSGCHIKGAMPQACNAPRAWPFPVIAALAAARKPDLVIHVGDYYYREAACPQRDAGCAGSPHGDSWATWRADLFDPAAPLLAAAPWVFVRGNHESCKRGGPGWFRLLDAAPRAKTCPATSDSFAVDLGGVRLWVVDSAETDDFIAPGDKVADFASRLVSPPPGAGGGPAWIVTHRPIWDSARLENLVGDGLVNATERAAARRVDLSGVGLVISGHVHNLTALSFGAARPPQLIAGTGGDTLDLGVAPPATAGRASVDGLAADIFTMGRWGYFVLDRRGADWVGAFRDQDDRIAALCRLHSRVLACRTP